MTAFTSGDNGRDWIASLAAWRRDFQLEIAVHFCVVRDHADSVNGGHQRTGIPWFLQRDRRLHAIGDVVWYYTTTYWQCVRALARLFAEFNHYWLLTYSNIVRTIFVWNVLTLLESYIHIFTFHTHRPLEQSDMAPLTRVRVTAYSITTVYKVNTWTYSVWNRI